MSLRSWWLLLLAGLSLGACATLRRNPEQQACTARCVEAKNACLVEAMDAEEISFCDADHDACVEPCLAMPRYLRD
jgi:hypothetical protein